jgi:hypothetical protein
MKQIVVKINIHESEYRQWSSDMEKYIRLMSIDFRNALMQMSIKNYDLEITEEEV